MCTFVYSRLSALFQSIVKLPPGWESTPVAVTPPSTPQEFNRIRTFQNTMRGYNNLWPAPFVTEQPAVVAVVLSCC